MKLDSASKQYQVPPESRVRLRDCDPRATDICPGGGKQEAAAELERLSNLLHDQQRVLYAQGKHRVLVVIQAMDAGGKDGCVRNVFCGVDPQGTHVRPFKKPSEEDLAHDFLWRVHPYVPANGELVIFNRSHYEDIIAVRVKKLFGDEVWKRRYRHVVDFERMLAEEGTTIIKLFLHISKAEQKKRLQSRIENPAKHWKFNPDDLEDRARWDEFVDAYEDLIGKTSTEHAPWYVIPSDRKWYRNLAVAKLMTEKLGALNMTYPEPPADLARVKID